jgi:hypothetical protein
VVYEFVLMAFRMDIIPVGFLIQGLLLHGFHLLFWLRARRGAVIGIPVLLSGFQARARSKSSRYVYYSSHVSLLSEYF